MDSNLLKRQELKYKRRKLLFIVVLFLLLLLSVICLLFVPNQDDTSGEIIRAAVCGAVKRPAVYSLPKGSDLAQLVRLAEGTTADADLDRCNLERVIMHDSVYHIPRRAMNARNFSLNEEISKIKPNKHIDLRDSLAKISGAREIRRYTILYIGLPAVFTLIDYYPDGNRIHFTHIPHTTVFLQNNYRLTDILFTLDVAPTIRLIQNKLNIKIDYYLLQNRFTFIRFVDMLGGVNL